MSARRCVVPGCKEAPQGRGLCKRHLQMASTMVKRTETTWEELEKLGLARPKKSAVGEMRTLLEKRRRRR